MKNILLIPKLRIHNANALSSPYTIGFPAMTAWLGAMHALERKLQSAGFENVHFNSMAVVCHKIDLQTYKGSGDYIHSIIGTGNPLDKKGNRPSFIEEARCHLTVSLLFEYSELDPEEREAFVIAITSLLHSNMKMASGDILSFEAPSVKKITDEKELKAIIRKLMPGHCLIERRDLFIQAMEAGQDGIDGLLDYLKVTHRSEIDENDKVIWESRRKEKGWIVPIATGFHGVSELAYAENQRDCDTPHRFAESMVTLGEFMMPYRINDLDNMLWHYHFDVENNLYFCKQNKPMIEI